MDKIFRLRVAINPKNNKTIKLSDPNEVYIWADYFGMQPKELLASFTFYMMRVLKLRVHHSIETQTIDGRGMRVFYKELSLKTKKKNPKNEGRYWKDTEFIMNSMQVWLSPRNEVMFGIPKHILHPESKTPAYLIFLFLEKGTKKNGKQIIPPRPLIIPHLQFILKRIDDYWVYFINLVLSKKIEIKNNRIY